ncbi:MAG: TIGR02757 family protein [Deltaproteobacteria bacterium]|nr:TIGR02757 family protein [Deltaproteobacteria bacterium]
MEKTALKTQLNRLYRTFDLEFLSTDPLEFVHRYKTPEDREIVGLVSSSLAYGKVATIKKSIARVMETTGPHPARFVKRLYVDKTLRDLSGFKHRFNDGKDIVALLYIAKQMIEEAGSIGAFFMKGYSPDHRNIKEALSVFSESALGLDTSPIYGKKTLPKNAGVRFFFPNPLDGSPCKRLNLYLRWMVRRGDSLDFGQWKGVDPAKLVIPLDTHIARISKNIGLTKRASADWKMAEEITASLAALDPKDPVKYDFALCRLGILDKCPARADRDKCEACLIRELCVL